MFTRRYWGPRDPKPWWTPFNPKDSSFLIPHWDPKKQPLHRSLLRAKATSDRSAGVGNWCGAMWFEDISWIDEPPKSHEKEFFPKNCVRDIFGNCGWKHHVFLFRPFWGGVFDLERLKNGGNFWVTKLSDWIWLCFDYLVIPGMMNVFSYFSEELFRSPESSKSQGSWRVSNIGTSNDALWQLHVNKLQVIRPPEIF